MLADALPVKLLPYEVKLFFDAGDHGRGTIGLLSNMPASVMDSIEARSEPFFNGTLPDYPPLSPSDALLYGNRTVNFIPH